MKGQTARAIVDQAKRHGEHKTVIRMVKAIQTPKVPPTNPRGKR